MDDLTNLDTLWQELQERTRLDRFLWWPDVTGSSRRFFRACQREVQLGYWGDAAARWLDWLDSPSALGFLRDAEQQEHHWYMARLHLLCTQAVLTHGAWTAPDLPSASLEHLVDAQRAPLGFLLDLAQELGGGDVRPAVARTSLPALLVDEQADVGVVAQLTLERVPDGRGDLYTHPQLAFIRRDAAFQEAERNARAAVERLTSWPADADVRWSLSFPKGWARPNLTGPSAGAAFALGLLHLLDPRRPSLDPGWTVTGAVDERGAITSVEGYEAKLKAAREHGLKVMVPEADAAGLQASWADRLPALEGAGSIVQASKMASGLLDELVDYLVQLGGRGGQVWPGGWASCPPTTRLASPSTASASG